MEIEDQFGAVLVPVRREMAPEGGSVHLVRLDGQIACVELSGPRSLSWTSRVTFAVQDQLLPQLTVLTSLRPGVPGRHAGARP